MKRLILLIAFFVVGCSGQKDAPTPDNDELPEPTTIVTLTFDDTRDSQFQVGAIVAARQMRATFYVNSPRIGRDGYMTAEQLTMLAQAGNEIGGHTLAHLHLAELDSDEVEREICDDRVALLNLGFEVSTFAYPFGSEGPGIRRLAERCGYSAARDSTGLAIGSKCPGCPQVNAMKPDDVFAIKAVGRIGTTTTLAELQQAVIDAETAGGGWVPFVFHHVCDGCAANAISAATLTAFVDWLAERRASGTGVKTMSEVLASGVKPAVQGPIPGVAANLIKNASLEADGEDNDIPDCWHQRGSGNNEATFTTSNVAFAGLVAHQITISSYGDGSRRLFTRTECPLPARAGHSYRISSWYFADTPPRFGVYYRTTSAMWKSLEQSPPLPTSPVYIQGVHTTAPLPADATAISIGLGISGVGSITMDAFDAVDASAPLDNAPPAVALTGPADGSTVTSTVTINAAASDPDGIERVDFRINGALHDFDDSEPFELRWNTDGFESGSYVITARALDRAGKVTFSTPLTVTVGAP